MDDLGLITLAAWTAAMLRASMPLLLATVGETLTQRVGIINLGVEGQMLMGAAAGFAVAATSGSVGLGLASGAAAGFLLAGVHAALCLGCGANQIGSGIATWMIALGLTSFFGRSYIGGNVSGFAPLGDGPLLGQITITVPAVLLLVGIVGVWLYRTRTGLSWRIVGESFEVARAIGLKPRSIQLAGILAGGVFSGLAGAVLSVDYTHTWANDMTKGRGFVAVGLVIVARWNPFLVLPVVLLFGLCEAATLRLQAMGLAVSPYLIACLPYVVSLLCVVIASLKEGRIGGMPTELKSVFTRS